MLDTLKLHYNSRYVRSKSVPRNTGSYLAYLTERLLGKLITTVDIRVLKKISICDFMTLFVDVK